MNLLDPRVFLELPRGFGLFKRMVAPESARRVFVDQHVRARPGDRVLDIGCGLGDILELLPPVEYTGFDLSPSYVKRARRLYGDRGRFICASVTEYELGELAGRFDIVIANGVLHHLDDREAHALVDTAHAALAPGGRLVTKDGCYADGQSRASRFLVSLDRGRHVRREDEYLAILRSRFGRVEGRVYHHLLRIPYSNLMVESSAA